MRRQRRLVNGLAAVVAGGAVLAAGTAVASPVAALADSVRSVVVDVRVHDGDLATRISCTGRRCSIKR